MYKKQLATRAQIMVMGAVYLYYYLITYSLYNIYDSYRSSDMVGLSCLSTGNVSVMRTSLSMLPDLTEPEHA